MEKKHGSIKYLLFVVPVCKARWNNIRDNFRKSLKKRMAQDEEKVTQSKKYKYEDQLEFLMPFIKIRDTDDILDSFVGANTSVATDPLANIKHDPEESDDSDIEYSEGTDQEDQDQDEVTVTKSKQSSQFGKILISSNCIEENGLINNVSKEPVSLEINKKRKADDEDLLKYDNSETTSINLVKYLLEQNEKTNQQSTHPVDAFLAGLAPTLKSLSPYHLNIAKSKIFNVVQELEMNQIMNIQPPFETPVTKFFISPSSSPLQSSTSPSSSTFIATTSVDLQK